MDKNNPKISVIMSVFNGEKYLREAIDSILAQKFNDFEFIIINDGSNDGTREILNFYSDQRLRIYHQENIGLTKSLNKALEMARGEYVARQDADDISHLNRFMEQLKFLHDHKNISLVGTRAVLINDLGVETGFLNPPCNDCEIKDKLKKGNAFCHGSIMARREDLIDAGGYREYFKYTQDFDLWVRLSEVRALANLDKYLYFSRRFSESISRKKMSLQCDYHLLVLELAKERKSKGQDSLELKTISSPYENLVNQYQIQASIIDKFKADRCMSIFNESINNKNLIDMFYYAFMILKYDFSLWRIRVIFLSFIKIFSISSR